MKCVLLTGATGFIGSHSLSPLISKGYEVHAISTNPPLGCNNPVIWHKANLFQSEIVDQVVEEVQPSHLMHLAWYTNPKLYWNSTENVSWVKASLDLIDSFIRNNGKRITIAGSCAEYNWNYGYCSERYTPLEPSSLYGVCKNSLHSIVNKVTEEVGLSSSWGRVFFLYGPGEPREKLVTSVIQSLSDNQPIKTASGNEIRDYLYVQDVADAFVELMDSTVQGPVNIGSGKPLAIGHILDLIGAQMQKNNLIQRGAINTVENYPFLVANTERLNNEVGWFPTYSISEGINLSIDRYNNSNLLSRPYH